MQKQKTGKAKVTMMPRSAIIELDFPAFPEVLDQITMIAGKRVGIFRRIASKNDVLVQKPERAQEASNLPDNYAQVGE